jgi:hypothetical protein
MDFLYNSSNVGKKNKNKFVTVPAKLVAAFDGSGKEDSPCLVVAGFIASHDHWSSFDSEWRARLKEDGLTYFHMVDFANSRKQFAEGWEHNEPRRRRLLSDLLGIIKSHVYRLFSSSIEMHTFHHLSDENKREYSLNAYVLAARSCAADVRRWQEREKFTPPTAYAFEDGDEGRGQLEKRFLDDNLSKPVFKPKKDRTQPDGSTVSGYTPLQAADILAYELHKPHRDLLLGKPRLPKFRWALEELLRLPGEPGYYSPKHLRDLNERLGGLSESTQHV